MWKAIEVWRRRGVLALLCAVAGSPALAQWEVRTTEVAEGPHALSGSPEAGAIGAIGVYCAGGAAIFTVSDFAGMQSVPLTAEVEVNGQRFAVELPHYFAGDAMGAAPAAAVAALRGGRQATVRVGEAAGRFSLAGSGRSIGRALAGCGSDDARAGPTSQPAPAAEVPAEVTAYAEATAGDVVQIRVFRGDYTGDGRPDALAFIYSLGGGNSVDLDVSLFDDPGGRLVHRRRVPDVFGSDPRDVTIRPDEIEVTTTTLAPGDPRCCPTGTTRYRIAP